MKKVRLEKLINQELLDFLKINNLLKYLKVTSDLTAVTVNDISLQSLSKTLLPLISLKDPAIEELSITTEIKQFDIIVEFHDAISQDDFPHKEYRIVV